MHFHTTTLVALATPSFRSISTPPGKEVHIHEDKLIVQLGERSSDGCTQWILDTGAMNHMTGEQSAFSDLYILPIICCKNLSLF